MHFSRPPQNRLWHRSLFQRSTPPRILDQLVELSEIHVFRAGEHEMLKQVGKACPAGRFPTGSHMELDGHRHDWVGVVLMKDNIQSVIERELLISDFSFIDLPGVT